jgi:protein ImuB
VIACLCVPLFPLAARLRSEPDLRDSAVVVCEGNGSAARIVAATRAARKAGIRPGFTLPQARALLPKLIARGRDRASERAAQEALLDAAGQFSPRVEDAVEGLVYLDGDGLERIFPGPDPARDLGRALIRAAEKEGLPARAGLAGSKLAARIAAALPDSPVVVPPGGEAGFLAPLPLARLAPEIDVSSTLARWGLRSIGDLAKLPASEIAARLGRTGEKLHEMARGLDPDPLVPRLPPPVFSEGMELEWPLTTLEPFLAMAGAALDRLLPRLAVEGLGCARLETALHLEPEGHDVRSIPLPAPTRDPKTLLRLLQLDLERRPPGASVVGFAVTLHPDRPRRGQMTLFGPPDISPDLLATALARLFVLLGDGRAGSPRDVDGHLPERYALVPYAPPPAPPVRRPPKSGRGLLAVRVLRPAVPMEVLTDDAGGPEGRLLSVRSLAGAAHGTRDARDRPPVEIAGPVRTSSGPWTLEDGWWSEAPVARSYWDVELESGGLYRLYHEAASGEWFADGVYD